MPTTPGGLPYPSASDAANVPADLQSLAESVEDLLDIARVDLLMLMGA